MKLSHKYPQIKIMNVALITIVILMVFCVSVFQAWAQMEHDMDMDMEMSNDRLIIDEVKIIKGSITKIKEFSLKGSFDTIKSGLMMIEMN